jgi:DeoR/GlpR family transcriptional regulator of sugar metabolism
MAPSTRNRRIFQLLNENPQMTIDEMIARLALPAAIVWADLSRARIIS